MWLESCHQKTKRMKPENRAERLALYLCRQAGAVQIAGLVFCAALALFGVPERRAAEWIGAGALLTAAFYVLQLRQLQRVLERQERRILELVRAQEVAAGDERGPSRRVTA